MIFYSFPVVGLCMTGDNLKYFYTNLLPLLEENFEKLSKPQKMPYLYQQVDNKKSEGTFLGQHFTKMIIFKIHFSKAHKKVLSKTNDTFFNVGNFLETLKI